MSRDVKISSVSFQVSASFKTYHCEASKKLNIFNVIPIFLAVKNSIGLF
jgi:hypothetical protein